MHQPTLGADKEHPTVLSYLEQARNVRLLLQHCDGSSRAVAQSHRCLTSPHWATCDHAAAAAALFVWTKMHCSYLERVDRYTCRTPHLHMYSHSTKHTAQMSCVQWLKTSCAPKKKVPHPRVVVRPLLHATLSTSSPSLSSTSLVLLSSSSPNPDLLSTYPLVHWEDPRQDGTSTEFHSSTGYELKRIKLNRIPGQTTKSNS